MAVAAMTIAETPALNTSLRVMFFITVSSGAETDADRRFAFWLWRRSRRHLSDN
jgi:hypothetical protein